MHIEWYLVFETLIMIVKSVFFYFFIPYFVYTRVIDVAASYFFYMRQNYKVSVFGRPWPVLGNLLMLHRAQKEIEKNNENWLCILKAASEGPMGDKF